MKTKTEGDKTSDKMKQELFYIRTSGYVGNSPLWWAVEARGYTPDLNKAGKYTREEADAICRRRPGIDRAYSCDVIDNHENAIQRLVNSQYLKPEDIAITYQQ